MWGGVSGGGAAGWEGREGGGGARLCLQLAAGRRVGGASQEEELGREGRRLEGSLCQRRRSGAEKEACALCALLSAPAAGTHLGAVRRAERVRGHVQPEAARRLRRRPPREASHRAQLEQQRGALPRGRGAEDCEDGDGIINSGQLLEAGQVWEERGAGGVGVGEADGRGREEGGGGACARAGEQQERVAEHGAGATGRGGRRACV